MPIVRYPNVPYPKPPQINIDTLEGVSLPTPPQPFAPNGPRMPYYWTKGGQPYKMQSNFVNYNDPYELNSLADAILTTFNKDMKRWDLGGLENIPLLNIIPSIAQTAYNTTLKPLIKGDFKALGVNNLVNFAETMDILANPVKGLFMEGGQGFVDAMGWGANGRKNYDANTGNIVTDMMVEIVADPLNWVTLFGKSVVTAGAKGSLKATLKEVGGEAAEKFAKEFGEETAEKVYKDIAKNAIKAYLEGDHDTMFKSITAVAENYSRKNLIQFKNVPLPEDFVTALKNAEQIVQDWMATTNIQALQKIITPVERLETALFKAALGTSGITPTWWSISRGLTWVSDAVKNRTYSTMKPFMQFDGTISFSDYTAAKDTFDKVYDNYNIALQLTGENKMTPGTFSQIMRESVLKDRDTLQELFQKHWSDPDKALDELTKFLQDKHKVNTLEEYIDILNDINAKADNAFLDVVLFYEEQMEYVKQLREVHAYKTKDALLKQYYDMTYTSAEHVGTSAIKEAAKTNISQPFEIVAHQRDLIKTNEKSFFFKLKKLIDPNEITASETYYKNVWEAIPNTPVTRQNAKAVMDKASERLELMDPELFATNQDNIKVILQNALEDFKDNRLAQQALFNSDDLAPSVLYAYLTNAYNKWDREVLRELLREMELVLSVKNDPLNLMVHLYGAVRQNLTRFSQDIKNQILEITMHFGRTGELTKFNYNKFNTMETLFYAFERYNKTYHAAMKNTPEIFKAPSYKNFIERADRMVRVQGNMIDKLQQLQVKNFVNYAKSLEKVWIDPIKIQGVTLDLMKLFNIDNPDDMWGAVVWLQNTADYTAEQTQEFIASLSSFLKANPQNFEEYATAWNDFSREVYMLPARMNKKSVADVVEFDTDLKARTALKAPHVNKLQEKLNEVNPFKYMQEKLTMQSEGALINFKLEQTYNTLVLMSNEEFNTFIMSINSKQGLGAWVVTMAESAATLDTEDTIKVCKDIVAMAQNYQAYTDLLNTIERTKLREHTRTALLTTLQKYAIKEPGQFLNNMDYYLKEIYQGIEDYTNTRLMRRSLSLEQFKKDLHEYVAQKFPNLELHSAVDDVELLELVIKEELAKDFVEDPLTKYIIADIETSGFNYNSGSILEIGFKGIGGKAQRLYRNLKGASTVDIPQERLLNKFFPNLSKEDQIAKFYEKYGKDGLEEFDILTRFVEQLQDIVDQGITPKLVFHNGDKFDVDFIKGRMQYYGLDVEFFNKIEKIDTLKLLKKKEGYLELIDFEKTNIKNMLQHYAMKMQQIGGPKLINPSNGELAENLMKLSNNIKLAGKNKKIGFTHMSDTTLYELAEHFRYQAIQVYEQLQYIARANEQMSWLMLDEKWLKDIDGAKFFVEYAQSILGWSPEHIVEVFGNYMNPSKFLYALSDGVNYIGYRRSIDFDKIFEYFKFKPDDLIDPRQAKMFTNIARSLDRAYERIKHPHRLIIYENKILESLQRLLPKEDYIGDLLNRIHTENLRIQKAEAQLVEALSTGRIDGLVFQEKMNMLKIARVNRDNDLMQVRTSFFKSFRTDKADVRSNWAILQYVYNSYKRDAARLMEFENAVDPDVLKLLKYPEYINTNIIKDDDINRLFEKYTVDIDNDIAKPEDWRNAVLDAQKSAEAMADLGRDSDRFGTFRAKTQSLSAALMDVHDMLKAYEAKMNNRSIIDRLLYNKKLKAYADSLAEQQVFNILTMSADDLQKLMIWRAPWIEFDFIEHQSKAYMQKALTQFLNNAETLAGKHIGVYNVGDRYFLYLKKSGKIEHHIIDGKVQMTLNGDIISKPALKDLDIALANKVLGDEEMAHHLTKARQAIHRLSGDGGFESPSSLGSLGDVVTKSYYAELYKLLPEEVVKEMEHIDFFLHENFFKEVRFNFTNLGSLAARQVKQQWGYGTIVSLYQHGAQNASIYAKTKVQYAQLWYNSDLSINVGWMKNATDAEIIEALHKQPEYVLTALIEDKKLGYKVIAIEPKTAKDIQLARRLNAVVMDYQTFSKAFETINHNEISEGTLKMWNKIVYLYKVGYLMDPGVILRNYIDSTLKNINETGSFFEVFKTQYEAMRLWSKYDKAVDYIINMDANKRFLKENFEKYFNNPMFEDIRHLDKDAFDFVHVYAMDGSSAGLSGRWDKYYKLELDNPDAFQEMWGTIVHMTRKTMKPNQYVEQISRLTEYIMLAKRGLANNEAFQRIAKTHFDYAIKTNVDRMVELVFPFYTFTMKNLHYWLQALEEHPWIASFYRDAMTPAWNFDDTSYEELSRNRSLQYQILSGAIPLHENGLTLKTNPSFIDVYNIFTQPFESIMGKTVAPIQELANISLEKNYNKLSQWSRNALNVYDTSGSTSASFLEQTSGLVPIVSTLMQRYGETGQRNFERTGMMVNKALPGVFGATLRYAPTRRGYLPKAPRQYGGYMPRPKKPKKFYPKKAYTVKGYKGKVYYQNYWARPKAYDSFYKKHYSKTGASKLKMRMQPVKPQTLKYRLKDLFHYYR